MTTRLLLGKVLEVMCERNDHDIINVVLRTIRSIRKSGYITTAEELKCYNYCSNTQQQKLQQQQSHASSPQASSLPQCECQVSLGDVLEAMCDRNDHETVLTVMQILGFIRKSGYMTLLEQVNCLSYCANRFAENGNTDFFKEFIDYMPDITFNSLVNPFNTGSKCHYYAAKYSDEMLYHLQSTCTALDISSLKEWFMEYLIQKHIHQDVHVTPLLEKAEKLGQKLSTEAFRNMCTEYIVPMQMKTGN